MNRFRPRGDDGAVAIIVALMALVIFGLAALAMDLGNAFTRKRDVQFQADFAALAGAADNGLPAPSDNPEPTHDAVVQAADYLFRNHPQNDNGALPLTAAELALDLTDDNDMNGEAYYGHFNPTTGALVPSRYELTVRTPPALIKYGFAAVFGTTQDSVVARATVGLRSPGSGTMPFFAVQGCDYGPQTLSDPANGQVQPVVPNMRFPTETNKSTLTSIAPPARVNLNSDPAVQQKITINGTKLSGVTKVGFFRDITFDPNDFFETPPFAANLTTGNVADVVVPVEVTSIEDVWWVRVFGPQNGNDPPAWSKATEALPLRVGDALLECTGASNDGNFGSLRLPRSTGTTAEWLPDNIALGLEAPLSLAVYPGSPPPALCDPNVSPAVYSTTTGGSAILLPGTNCLSTDTGLPANDLTQGLVTGGSGRLLKPTAPGCSPERDDDERTIAVGGGSGTAINDDTLSCFLTNTTTKVGDIASPTYAGPPVLSPDIYSSPRFFWVPVLGTQPAFGGSQTYSIVDFRAAFITSDSVTSTKDTPVFNDGSGVVSASATNNGLNVENNGITRMRVVFFNYNALPADAGGAATTAYMGVGPKVLAMTN